MQKSFVKPLKELRVAFIGVWKIPCGISTYSEWLWAEQFAEFKEYKIFTEYSDNPPEPNVLACWKRGQPLDGLISAIHEYNPDVVFIQHEYGIFPVARHWISLMAQLQKYRTIVTMHSVHHHKDKVICEAVIPEIIVHTEGAANILKNEKKVPSKVHVITHGGLPCSNPKKLYNLYHSPHTILQFGFGFKYKGWENSLAAVATLKEQYPDIFFTGLFSISPQSLAFHETYHAELMKFIGEKGIVPHVGLIKGYQSQETLESFIRVNNVAIFPYVDNPEHRVYGCSGAARLAMHYGIPTIVSNIPLFEDLEGVCPRVGSTEELCAEIRKMFDPKQAKAQVERQSKFLADNSWQNAASKYLDLLR